MADFDLPPPPPDEDIIEGETQLLPLPDGVTADVLVKLLHPDPVVRIKAERKQIQPPEI